MRDTDVRSPAERQRTATRQAILDAATRMLHEEPSVHLAHEAVAARAGVAARTVYRHFPARADLTLALWERIRDPTGTGWPRTEPEILPALRTTYAQFDAHEALARAALGAASSTQHAVHGAAEGRAAFREALADLLAALPPADGDRLVAGCVAICSAPFWEMLRDRGQLAPAEARKAGATAMDALLAAARARAAAGRDARAGRDGRARRGVRGRDARPADDRRRGKSR
jgi:AcrR family transcriptional regulator